MKDKRDEAIDLFKNAQYSAAIPLCLDLLDSDFDDCYIHYMVGHCYNFNGQYLEAIESLKKSEELMKDSASIETKRPIYLALGIAYQNNKEFDKAVAVLENGISKCPKEWKLYNSLGLTYKLMNNLREALHSYTKAQELIVEAATHTEILEDEHKTLFFDPVTTQLTLRSSPEYCTIMNNIGGVYIAAGDLESAEKALKESIEFIPDGFNYPPPHDGLAFINSQKKA